MVHDNSTSDIPNDTNELNGAPVIDSKSMKQVYEETMTEALAAIEDPYDFDHPIESVAVVGAGPSGLLAAKALLEQGFKVQVFERNTKVGGVWVYTETAGDELDIPVATEKHEEWLERDLKKAATKGNTASLDYVPKSSKDIEQWLKNHHQPPTACYNDLFNNTSTPCLGSFEFPWPDNTPYFIPHSAIQNYYQDYAKHFGLDEHIQLNTSLDNVVKKDNKWELTLTRVDAGGDEVCIHQYQAEFDGVVLATGQHQDPVVPPMNGLQEFNTLFPGKVIHSKQFRRTNVFENKNVLVVGGRVSAVDVVRLASTCAKNVYMSYRGPFITGLFILDLIRSAIPDLVIHKPGIEGFWSKDSTTEETVVDGTITFTDGSTLRDIDLIVFATGYRAKHSYLGLSRTWALNKDMEDRFTFELNSNGPLVIMDDKKIYNTYKDIFLIADPTLAFVGAPQHITTTPFFDYQAQAIARVWSRSAYLPSKSKMASFSLTRTGVCPPYRMDHESERLRAQTILPWLNLHSDTLVPDRRLPILQGPPDTLEAVWKKSVDLYPEFVKTQYKGMAMKYQERQLR